MPAVLPKKIKGVELLWAPAPRQVVSIPPPGGELAPPAVDVGQRAGSFLSFKTLAA